jgi:hypothetical protein
MTASMNCCWGLRISDFLVMSVGAYPSFVKQKLSQLRSSRLDQMISLSFLPERLREGGVGRTEFRTRLVQHRSACATLVRTPFCGRGV